MAEGAPGTGARGPSARGRCAEILKSELGVVSALLTTSCTSALEAAALIFDLDSRSEVVLPSFTHPGTANAFALRGARLVFVDIREDNCNINEQQALAAMGEYTRALVAVHYAGVGCDMPSLLEACRRHGAYLVEDAAHALFASFRGAPLGSFGTLAAMSFHHTKNLSCSKGGALLVNDPELVQRAEHTVDSGTDRAAFLRGEVAQYSWHRPGVNALLAEPLAEILLAQLEQRDALLGLRRSLWTRYHDELAPWAEHRDVQLPNQQMSSESNHHIFFLRLASAEQRRRFSSHMSTRGVAVTTHYVPLHLSPMGRSLGYGPGDLPVTEKVAATLVRLPLTNHMSEAEQEVVIRAATSFG